MPQDAALYATFPDPAFKQLRGQCLHRLSAQTAKVRNCRYYDFEKWVSRRAGAQKLL